MTVVVFLKNNLKIFTSTCMLILHAPFQHPSKIHFIYPISTPSLMLIPTPSDLKDQAFHIATAYPNVREHVKD